MKNECRCWSAYPNPQQKEKCKNYECIKPFSWEFSWEIGTRPTKTVCRLKDEEKEKEK